MAAALDLRGMQAPVPAVLEAASQRQRPPEEEAERLPDPKGNAHSRLLHSRLRLHRGLPPVKRRAVRHMKISVTGRAVMPVDC
mmetsp:Transcript_55637/g.120161  ORF Transcript_55637/g.120161 Transcript_55637/m.120161 type:complete len:83 (-) Transcript_55637:40-288(-)